MRRLPNWNLSPRAGFCCPWRHIYSLLQRSSMWYTETDSSGVVEGSPMKEKTCQTRCGTIHYWANASNPDIRRAVALENLISDGRQPDIAEIQTRIRVTVDDNAFSVTAGGLSSRTVHRLFLPRRPPCSGGVQGDLFQYRLNCAVPSLTAAKNLHFVPHLLY